MRTTLRLAALLVAVIALGFWFSRGPNLGLSRNSSHRYKDPVTELEVDIPENHFIPGIEFLGAGLTAAMLLFGGSFFFAKKSIPLREQSAPPNPPNLDTP